MKSRARTAEQEINSLMAMGQMIIQQATELRESLAEESQAPRKGLTNEQRAKLIARRMRTAFKVPQTL